MRKLIKIVLMFTVLLSLGRVLAIDADKLCAKDNITLKECLNEMKSVIQEQNTQLKALIPGPWNDLILPPNWRLDPGHSLQCRRNGDWIEFKGIVHLSEISGMPFLNFQMLPVPCWPKAPVFTVVPCFMPSTNTFSSCDIHFYQNGNIVAYSPNPTIELRFAGMRIWGEK